MNKPKYQIGGRLKTEDISSKKGWQRVLVNGDEPNTPCCHAPRWTNNEFDACPTCLIVLPLEKCLACLMPYSTRVLHTCKKESPNPTKMEKSIPDQLRELAEKIEKESNSTSLKKEGGRSRAKKGTTCYLIRPTQTLDGKLLNEVNRFIEQNDLFDDFHYNTGNYYRTKEEAQKAADHETKWLTSLMKIKDYIATHFGVFQPDWKNYSQEKWTLVFNRSQGKLDAHCLCYNQCHSPFGYLRSDEHAEQLAKALPEELEFVICNPFKL